MDTYQEGFEEGFEIENQVFVISNTEVNIMEIRKFLKGRLRRKQFEKNTVLKIFSGAHGKQDGELTELGRK